MEIDVRLGETAWRDLDEIYDWIADRSDPETARNYVGRILRFCGSLQDFPERGTPRKHLAPGVRTIAFEGRATVAYRSDKDKVTILRVLHYGRDLGSVFPS